MSEIKISKLKLVESEKGYVYQFSSSKSLKGKKEGIILSAIENAVNENDNKSDKEIYNEIHPRNSF